MFRRMRSRSATIVGAGRARPARAVDRPVAACPARRRGPRLPLLGQVPHPDAELVRERLEVFDAVPKQGYFGKICSDAFVGARLGAGSFPSGRPGGIIKGAKPANLPVQQPARFNLVINTAAAKALGPTIPESFLLRADEPRVSD